MKDDETDVGEPRTEGKFIDVSEHKANSTNHERREGRSITPAEQAGVDVPPESIPGGPQPEQGARVPAFQMKSLPLKGLKSFIYAAFVLLFVVIAIETYSVIVSLWDKHWIFAAAFFALVATVFSLGIRTTYFYLRGSEGLDSLDGARNLSDRMRYSRDNGEADSLITTFKNFYKGKPQQKLLDDSLNTLEDYCDDGEALEHIERSFLEKLDREAMQVVSQHCLYTGAAIGISPWAVMDVGLALWRNVKLMEEISSIYGFRPSFRNRVRLLRLVVEKMAFVGGTQALMDTAMEGVSSLGAGVPLLASFAQGVGASVYTARIGIATMQVTRPVRFDEKSAPRISTLVSPVIDLLRENLLKMVKSGKRENSHSI